MIHTAMSEFYKNHPEYSATPIDADQIVIACGGGGIPVLEQANKLQAAIDFIGDSAVREVTITKLEGDIDNLNGTKITK